MNYQAQSIRTFIGARNYNDSRAFYKALDFDEFQIDSSMSYFKVNDQLGFYLQDYHVKDWVNNSMVFLEVDDVEKCHQEILEKGLHNQYKLVRLSDIKIFDWGRELFLHDPSGVLWHFGEFK